MVTDRRAPKACAGPMSLQDVGKSRAASAGRRKRTGHAHTATRTQHHLTPPQPTTAEQSRAQVGNLSTYGPLSKAIGDRQSRRFEQGIDVP